MIKSVLFRADGTEVAVARMPTSVSRRQPGWAEQDMEEVWQAVVTTIRQVAARSLEPLQGLVTTAQGDGCWLVNEKGQPAGPAILWNDGRASAWIEQWHAEGIAEQAFRRSGSVPYAGLPCGILRWLQSNEPQRLARARWALTANGWLTARLTGRFVADLSDSSNPFCDLATSSYSSELLALFGLQALSAMLPPIVTGDQTRAPLTDAAASELGLASALPVVMAPYDIVSTAYGAGAVSPGQSCVILGTTLCAETILRERDPGTPPLGTMLSLHDGAKLLAIPTLTGCEALEWAVKMLALENIEELEQVASSVPAEEDSPFFLPYLSPAGERAPFLAPEASGSFHGVTLYTTRGDLARAVYEGLAFVIRECISASGASASCRQGAEVRVCGGGARSDLWCQMIANAVNLNVVRTVGGEVGARGAHLFALAVTGETASVAEGAHRHIRPARVFSPDAATRERNDRRFDAFLALRSLAREQWKILRNLKTLRTVG